jgi:hypothetical protein
LRAYVRSIGAPFIARPKLRAVRCPPTTKGFSRPFLLERSAVRGPCQPSGLAQVRYNLHFAEYGPVPSVAFVYIFKLKFVYPHSRLFSSLFVFWSFFASLFDCT